MADKGIIFSAPMVRALLDGRKTQTRRLLKPQPRKWEARVIDIREPTFDEEFQQWGQWETIWNRCSAMWEPEEDVFHPLKLAYAPGDRLYVRESGIEMTGVPGGSGDLFRHDVPAEATSGVYWSRNNQGPGAGYMLPACDRTSFLRGAGRRVRPSIHMPRWASRLWLAVTEVRVQRLRSISGSDAVAEGVRSRLPDNGIAQQDFADLWNSLHTKPGERWHDDPWVVAVSFDVHRGNIDAAPEADFAKPQAGFAAEVSNG